MQVGWHASNFVGLAGCVLAGVPIAFCFGLATFGYLALTTNTPMLAVVGRMDEGMSPLTLLAVPLFVFLGLLMCRSPRCSPAGYAIGRVNPDEGIRPIVAYLLALLAVTVVVAFVPWLSVGFL